MSVTRLLIFIVLTFMVLGGLNFYVFRWARNAWALGGAAQRRLKLTLGVSLAGMVLGRVAGRFWAGSVVTAVVATASTVQLAVIISAVFLLLADLVFGVGAVLARLRAKPEPDRPHAAAPEAAPEAVAPAPSVPAAVPRRAFMLQAAAGSAFLIGGSSSLYGALKGRSDYSLEELPFKLPGLSRSLDGFTIAQLSDVHIGVYVGESELRIAEELLRRAKPDLIVLTGDLLDNDARLADQLGRFVRRLTPLARAGVVAVSGNHDYFAGVDAVERAISRAGGRMLRNRGEVLGGPEAGVALLGVDDVMARREGGGPDSSTARSRHCKRRTGWDSPPPTCRGCCSATTRPFLRKAPAGWGCSCRGTPTVAR